MTELKNKLLQLCNESGLPLEAILFVVRDLYRDVDEAYSQFIKQVEAAQAEQPIKEKQEEAE